MTDPETTTPILYDPLAERSVLGAAMTSPRALADVVGLLSPADFFDQRHAFVFEAIAHLAELGTAVDPITVQAELERRGKPNAAVFLLDVYGEVPTAANAARYAELVADKALLRRLAETGQRAVQIAYSSTSDAAAAVEDIRAEFDQVASARRSSSTATAASAIAEAALQRYAAPQPSALPTGLAELDDLLNGGLRPGTLTVVGARPGVGKSVLGVNLGLNVARNRRSALIFSLEMTEAEVGDRMIANLASVELDRITRHRLSDRDWQRVEQAAISLRGWPLNVLDFPNIGLTGIRTLARDHLRSAAGLDLVVIDYLQLIRPADPRANREQQVAAISRGLKLLAKELGVPVVALAQVNRGSEARADKRPALADLRESGAIEADADAVILLHHDIDREGKLELHLPKNRSGRQGVAHIDWAPHYSRVGRPALAEAAA